MASSGWRRSRARKNPISSASGSVLAPRGSSAWNCSTPSVRRPCCGLPAYGVIRASIQTCFVSRRPLAPTSSANDERHRGPAVSDLFAGPQPRAPLAEALRPKSLDDVLGQEHLLGPGKPLRLAFEAGKLHSMVLWGPPGTGKTTIARLMADAFKAEFIALSAVLSGVKEIRDAVQRARDVLATSGRPTILFVDEVHRFNKAQQDAFLPFVEQGLITFVGATTENPSFEVISALLSRAAVYVLNPLSEDELRQLLERANQESGGTLSLDADAPAALVEYG